MIVGMKFLFTLTPILLLVIGIFLATNLSQTKQILNSFAQSAPNDMVAKRFADKVINVRDFGAKGDGITDDTDAIQRAINVAAQLEENGDDRRWEKGFKSYDAKQVFFPSGSYAISSLNLTDRSNIKLTGEAAPWGVRLYANKQTQSKPVVDATGSTVVLENMTILAQNIDGSRPNILPSVGILLASSERGGDSTANGLQYVSILGYFAKAGLYIYGSNDNSFVHTAVQSWEDGASALVITEQYNPEIISEYKKTVEFVQEDGTKKSITYSGINKEKLYTSDQTFIYGEFHTFKYDNGVFVKNAPSSSLVVVLHGANGVRFVGGVISGSGPALVHMNGVNREIVFDGNYFESENGFAPQNTIYSNSSNIFGLSLRNVNLSNGVQSNGAIIAGKSGTWIRGLNIEGFISGSNNISPTAKLIDIEDAPTPEYTVISDAVIATGGMEVKPGGSIYSTMILGSKVTKRAGSTYSMQIVP